MPTKATPFGKPHKGEQWDIDVPENIDSRGRIPAGNKYIGKLVELKKEVSKSSNNPMLTWSFIIVKGDQAGRDFNLWTALTPDSMWKVVETCEALGMEVPRGERLKIVKSELIGTLCLLTIEDDVYKGREQSKLSGIAPHPNGAGTKSSKAGISAAVADEDEDEDENDEEETEEQTEETEEETEEFTEEAEEEGLPEDEDEEETTVRRPKPAKKSAPVARRPAPPVRGGKGKSRL